MSNSVRFYFYTVDGQPIETNLSNLPMSGCYASIVVKVEGVWKKKLWKTKKGKTLFGRTEIRVFKSHSSYDSISITADTFGHDTVIVKEWSPVETEWFVLTRLQEGESYADRVIFEGEHVAVHLN